MIRIFKPADEVPEVLLTEGKFAQQILEDQYDRGYIDFDFKSSIYGHQQVKDKLIQLQGYKCCFCEAKIGHISYGDVEHFRPKAGWVQEKELLNRPGYYWLAYEWSNLFLSCQLCNQRHKRNFFPLQNPADRATSHHQTINDEQSLFIHLSEEDPEQFIQYQDEIPIAVDNNIRGEATIAQTGLRRKRLNDDRIEKLNPIRDLYNIAVGCPETDPEYKAQVTSLVMKYYNACQSDSYEYASMLRCFFKANPIGAV